MNHFVSSFHSSMVEAGKSPNTVTTYTQNAALFVDWLEKVTGEQFTGRILSMDAAEYSKYLSETKRQSLNTIKAKLTAVQKFAEYLSNSGEMPSIKVQQKKGTAEPEVEVLEKNEVYKLLRYVRNTENRLNIAIVVLLLNTGIRESELCNLELTDIEISDRKGQITIRNGKGNKYREIPLNVDARNALKDYIENARPSDAESQKLFIGQRGALTRSAVYKIVNKLGEKALGKNVYPHMLRHQCFTAMAKNPDVDLKTISSLAGHSNVELTAKYYINSSKQEQIDAVESLQLF
ncbi:MAG: tyrosine-type recombinase/integrase [Clostridia bacterium]|nr:tyrosine-type recombinase/integrase [Clostridia bacterium]